MLNKPESCKGCVLYEKPCGKTTGFVPASGSGDNGVLVILETPGEGEEQQGIPTVGKSGYFLWQSLKRVGIERDGFRIHNVLSCRPPNDKLDEQWYEASAIKHCEPNLDETIQKHILHAKEVGKTPIILTLGKLSVKRVMGGELSEGKMKLDYVCYPMWNQKYGCWVMASDDPRYLMRGKTELLPVMQFAFQRALEIATNGLKLDEPIIGTDYVLDPQLPQFQAWVEEFEQWYQDHPDTTFLSYDIETPHKKGADEETLDKDEADYTILQCSFSYRPGKAISAAWSPQNLGLFRRIFGSTCSKIGWNSQAYDDPRIMAQMPINGDRYDGMQMWHVLNSALPKGLGFVTPFYVHTTDMWKYLGNSSTADPLIVSMNGAFYNAKDSDMALRNFLGIKRDLEKSNLWDVYLRHMVEVHKVFNYMSAKGVKLDLEMRDEAEKSLKEKLVEIDASIEASVPNNVKGLKIYKKLPKELKDVVDPFSVAIAHGYEITYEGVATKCCPHCGAEGVSATHFKSVGKKKLKAGVEENPCYSFKPEKRQCVRPFLAKRKPFKISKKSLQAYQKEMRHRPVIDRKKQKATFDEKAILKLVKTYPKDKLYVQILEFRGLQKLLSTYIGVTQYRECQVPDDYQLEPGEKWNNAV